MLHLYLGGYYPIQIETVKIIGTRKAFTNTLKALSVFDAVVSDGCLEAEIDAETGKLMRHLLVPSILSSLPIDEYIKTMVKSYIRRKKRIVVNIYELRWGKRQLYGMAFEGDLRSEKTTPDNWDPNKPLSRNNLLSPNLFIYLPKVTHILIKTMGHSDKLDSCPFDMYLFLENIIQVQKWKEIIIEQKLIDKEHENKSWIYKLWMSGARENIVTAYKKHQLEISFHKQIQRWSNLS